IAAIAHPALGPGADPHQVLTGYEPLIRWAAGRGAQLALLPADHAYLREESYNAWLAGVRHWARQFSLWLILGYVLEGPEAGHRLLAIDPDGNIRGGCDRNRVWPPPLARFGPGLDWRGWGRWLLPRRELLVAPLTQVQRSRGLTPSNLLLRLLATTGRSSLVAVGGDASLFGAHGRLLSRERDPSGAVLMLAEIR
ncbi:MAG: hypothetical protein ACOY93_11840, partial [Bacillota bacterium]